VAFPMQVVCASARPGAAFEGGGSSARPAAGRAPSPWPRVDDPGAAGRRWCGLRESTTGRGRVPVGLIARTCGTASSAVARGHALRARNHLPRSGLNASRRAR
jgi:hypothetical protein